MVVFCLSMVYDKGCGLCLLNGLFLSSGVDQIVFQLSFVVKFFLVGYSVFKGPVL